MIPEGALFTLATRTASSMTLRCPWCTPSKLPIATTEPRASSGMPAMSQKTRIEEGGCPKGKVTGKRVDAAETARAGFNGQVMECPDR